MAQLGARLDGIEEVVGSNPIGSTKFLNRLRRHIGIAGGFCDRVCDGTTPKGTPRQGVQGLPHRLLAGVGIMAKHYS